MRKIKVGALEDFVQLDIISEVQNLDTSGTESLG